MACQDGFAKVRCAPKIRLIASDHQHHVFAPTKSGRVPPPKPKVKHDCGGLSTGPSRKPNTIDGCRLVQVRHSVGNRSGQTQRSGSKRHLRGAVGILYKHGKSAEHCEC